MAPLQTVGLAELAPPDGLALACAVCIPYSFIFKKELLVGFVVLFLFVFVRGKCQAVFLSARGGGRRGGATSYN